MQNQNDKKFSLLDMEDELSKLTTQLGALVNVVTTDGVVEQLSEEVVCHSLWIAEDLIAKLRKNHEMLFDELK